MSLNNMYIEDASRAPKTKKGYFIQKKVAIVGLILLALILIGVILITHFSTKAKTCASDDYESSSSKNATALDQMCSELICHNPTKTDGNQLV